MPEIRYMAGKVFVHHWPKDTPAWSGGRRAEIDSQINKNPDEKQIVVSRRTVRVDDYEFSDIRNVGISIPMFQNQSTLIFEGRCRDVNAHVHITTSGGDYLSVCSKLSAWRSEFFPDSVRR